MGVVWSALAIRRWTGRFFVGGAGFLIPTFLVDDPVGPAGEAMAPLLLADGPLVRGALRVPRFGAMMTKASCLITCFNGVSSTYCFLGAENSGLSSLFTHFLAKCSDRASMSGES